MRVDLTTAQWRKSSASTDYQNCVEVADLTRCVAVRDSKDPDGAKLLFSNADWAHFVASMKIGGSTLR